MRMYIIVNSDLKLSTGKLCAQVGHAVQDVVISCRGNKKRWNSYKNNGSAKIVLKADQQIFDELLECSCKKFIVTDAGKTECLEGTITTIVFPPMYESEVPEFIKGLKLL
jgi:peptidyl-tRNA hydrolase